MWKKCGWRERESRREGAGGAILRRQAFAKNESLTCRGGERHPGLLEGGTLRGVSLEWRPWSARDRYKRLPPRVSSAPVTADVRRKPRRGTPSSYATISVGTGRRHGTPLHADRDASFTRSFDPCSLILTMHRRGNSAVVGRSRRYRGWANSGNREEPAPGSAKVDEARLATHHCSAMSGVMRKEKEGDRGHRPCEEMRADGLVARTS
jgi:hypothetical protein